MQFCIVGPYSVQYIFVRIVGPCSVQSGFFFCTVGPYSVQLFLFAQYVAKNKSSYKNLYGTYMLVMQLSRTNVICACYMVHQSL